MILESKASGPEKVPPYFHGWRALGLAKEKILFHLL